MKRTPNTTLRKHQARRCPATNHVTWVSISAHGSNPRYQVQVSHQDGSLRNYEVDKTGRVLKAITKLLRMATNRGLAREYIDWEVYPEMTYYRK